MTKKLTVLLQTDFSLAKTGFGRNARALLEYLYKTGKYNLVHYCVGLPIGHPELTRTPWKSVGCLPNDPASIQELNKDPNLARQAGYGAWNLDRVIQEEKPDVYIATQDIWGVDFAIDKKWFKKINSIIWTTLDSLPILPSAVAVAPKVKNYWIWSDFATKALHKLGHTHVKTVHGAVETKHFKKLPDYQKKLLRQNNKIPLDAFIIGFVFRNQLRKSVPNLLEGYKMFVDANPQIKNPRLLLHTHWAEGWNIHKLADEYKIDKSQILTTYVCKSCNKYEVKPFTGHDLNCPHCKAEKSQITTGVSLGISEEYLNEIYNLMDVYCHPFTSGGQEIPIQEAKLAELITLVTNYSCGEEMCQDGAASLPLEWAEYREHGTEFIKASTYPSSICKQLTKVYKLSPDERAKMGKQAREWTVKNFSAETIGKFFEEFIDNAPKVDYSFDEKEQLPNPFCSIPEIKDDSEWILTLYKEILNRKEINKEDDGYKYWMNEISKGAKREGVEQYFRQVASKELQEKSKVDFGELLNKNDKGRVLVVMPESAGDLYLLSSLFPSIKSRYPEYALYVATKPEYRTIIDGNPYVDNWIEYNPIMDNLIWLEGQGKYKGHFNIAYLPHIATQRVLSYLHNGEDKIDFNIKEESPCIS
jgi:glycosyltransferase involved in cell wall biosynthesis